VAGVLGFCRRRGQTLETESLLGDGGLGRAAVRPRYGAISLQEEREEDPAAQSRRGRSRDNWEQPSETEESDGETMGRRRREMRGMARGPTPVQAAPSLPSDTMDDESSQRRARTAKPRARAPPVMMNTDDETEMMEPAARRRY
jgi:hypothetical protein